MDSKDGPIRARKFRQELIGISHCGLGDGKRMATSIQHDVNPRLNCKLGRWATPRICYLLFDSKWESQMSSIKPIGPKLCWSFYSINVVELDVEDTSNVVEVDPAR